MLHTQVPEYRLHQILPTAKEEGITLPPGLDDSLAESSSTREVCHMPLTSDPDCGCDDNVYHIVVNFHEGVCFEPAHFR